MKIAIIGGGALGSLLAARLTPLADVRLVTGWVEHAVAISRRGLILERLDGSLQTVAVAVVLNPAELAGTVDLALVSVKSHATRQAAEKAALVLASDGLALTLQNGLGNLEIIAAHVGASRATQGVTAQGATMIGPGRVRHAGDGPTYLAGPPESRAWLLTVADLFNAAGLATHLEEDLVGLIWGKLVVSAGINALTAILRVPNGALLERPSARILMAAAALETAAVVRRLGIRLPYADPVTRTEEVALATARNRSSMLQDILRAAPSEIDVINGAVVREGERLGVDTPVNRVLAQLVQAIEAGHDRSL